MGRTVVVRPFLYKALQETYLSSINPKNYSTSGNKQKYRIDTAIIT